MTVEGRVHIGTDRSGRGAYESVEAFVEALSTVGEANDAVIQAFDARYVAGEEHLAAAIEHATRAMDRGENIADTLAVEVLLYAAGRRQIDQAMEMGVGTGENQAVVLVFGPEEEAAAAAIRDLLEPAPIAPDRERIREFFSITSRELAATDADLETLVRERVALLEVEK